MKKKFLIILIILLILLASAGYYVYNTRQLKALAQKQNATYESCYQQEILGTTLISIINKAVNDNEQNGVGKEQNSIYYENNHENSIQISIKFFQSDDIVPMEKIAKGGSEAFVRAFATASFKCTKIEYHEKTNFVKSLYFEQTKD